MKTSEQLRVDFVPGLAVPGRLGLTEAPGKGGARSLEADLGRLRVELRTGLLVTLVGMAELRALGIENLVERVGAHGMESTWFPIADYSTPGSTAELEAVVEQVLARLRLGDTVVVHCWGGHGRSGLVAACCLVALGWKPLKAIAAVRSARPGAIETPEQEAFVATYAEARR